MSIVHLAGSDYYEGTDGVRRQYGPGIFDINDAGQIIGPHIEAATAPAAGGDDEIAPSQEQRVTFPPSDNGG